MSGHTQDPDAPLPPGIYHCLACGRTVDMADGDTFPRDDEHCSHQWEPSQPEDGRGPLRHTPGDWKVTPADTRYFRVESRIDGEYQHVANVFGRDSEVAYANARLIAATPKLLAASVKMMAFLKDLGESNPGFMRNLVLQDYAQWNEAMIELPAAIANAVTS